MMLAERREGISAKDLAHAVSHPHVMGRQDTVLGQMRHRGFILPRHVLEGVQAVVVEEVDRREAVEKCGELTATVAHDQGPVSAKLVGDEEVVGRLVRFMGQIDAVEHAFSVPGEGREYVSAGGAVQHPGLDYNPRPGRTHNEVESFEAQVPGGPKSLGTGKPR
jgi:hypothetical protein